MRVDENFCENRFRRHGFIREFIHHDALFSIAEVIHRGLMVAEPGDEGDRMRVWFRGSFPVGVFQFSLARIDGVTIDQITGELQKARFF